MLHELIEYGRSHGIAGEAGFTSKSIRWLIMFDADGRFLSVAAATQEDAGKPRHRILSKAPHLKFSGDTPMRQFLVDTAQYALLYDEPKPDDKLLRKHRYFLELLLAGSGVVPVLRQIADSLSNTATRQRICDELAAQSPKAKQSDNVSFAVIDEAGVQVIAEDHCWHNWWRGYFQSLFEKKGAKSSKLGEMRCFLSGELEVPAQTHPKIKGLGDVGGNIETTLVGFNLDAFCSFGLEQSSNAAISDAMAQQYAASLNDLIARRSRKLAGTKVVYWYVGGVRDEEGEDVLSALVDPATLGVGINRDEDEENGDGADSASEERREGQALARVGTLLDAIRSGKRSELRAARYCALTLSGNAGRVVIRDWMEGAFEMLATNVRDWFEDLSIVSRDGQRIVDAHKFAAVLAAPVRELSDVASPHVAVLWRCAVHGRSCPIPHEIMAQTLSRIRIDVVNDEPARHARLGLLKAYCNRKAIPMSSALNPDHPDAAYHCGRLFAVLAYIQYKALGDVGAGIVQRYYAAASATPALVLGRLIRTAQFHLGKIDDKQTKLGLDKRLGEIWGKLRDRVPATLSLEQQTLFALGYYHQKSYRGASADEPFLDEAV